MGLDRLGYKVEILILIFTGVDQTKAYRLCKTLNERKLNKLEGNNLNVFFLQGRLHFDTGTSCGLFDQIFGHQSR